MSTYILAKDYYADGAFDLSIEPAGSYFYPPLKTFLKVTDPREFNSSYLYAGTIFSTSPPTTRSLYAKWTANKSLTVDYVAFNKHSFDAVVYGVKLINKITIYKETATGNLSFLAIIQGSSITNKNNIVLKFNPVTLIAGEKIRITFVLNRYNTIINNWAYGAQDFNVSYIKIGQSYKLRELTTPLQIPYGASYESKNQKSDQGFVIDTKSKQLPTDMTIKFKSQNSTFYDNNEWVKLSYDLSRNPFFIYDDGGNLPLVPFCWLKNKTGAMSLNTNHLYDVTLKAQVKVYE
jgi:hypothetical protein